MLRTAVVALLVVVSSVRAEAQSEPYKVFETRPVITQGPYLVATSDSSTMVVWMTDTPSHSEVRFAKGVNLPASALTNVVEHQKDGLVPVGTRHAVLLTGLDAGATYSYQAVSTRVVKLKAYWPDKGLASESPIKSFTTFSSARPTASFSAVTDTHEDVARIRSLNKMIDWTTTEFLLHLGDAFHWLDSEDQLFRLWLEPTIAALGGTRPLIYARGNHELRGPFARELFDYIPTPENRFYFARDVGPVHLMVMDTGEDKPDDTNVYAKLNRTVPYRAEELAWLKDHVKTAARVASAPFRVVAMHQPRWGWLANGADEWIAVANEANVDLVIAGHNHKFSYTPPGPGVAHKYHLLVVGQDQVARVDATTAELKVTVAGTDGKVVQEIRIARR